MAAGDRDRMPDIAFRMMSAVMALEDLVSTRIDRRVAGFGVRPGMTIVDYGCGPARYTTRLSKLTGVNGLVYAVDVQELALQAVKRKMAQQHLENIVPVLARGYDTGLPDHVADMVCALDMFFGLSDPATFLREVRRITKPSGVLVIDDGHQPRSATLRKIGAAGGWRIEQESRDHLVCSPAGDG